MFAKLKALQAEPNFQHTMLVPNKAVLSPSNRSKRATEDLHKSWAHPNRIRNGMLDDETL